MTGTTIDPAPSDAGDWLIWSGHPHANAIQMCREECSEIHGVCPSTICPLVSSTCGPERTQLLRTVVYAPSFISSWLEILWDAATSGEGDQS